jgi:nucleoside-diphosphate-sugar epimerase
MLSGGSSKSMQTSQGNTLPKKQMILLTGATGFLGSNLLKALIQKDYRVIATVRSSSDTWRIKDVITNVSLFNISTTPLEKLFEQEVDIIVHCATDYGRKHIDTAEMLEANLIFPLRLLQLGKKYQVHGFINTDTILDKRVSAYSLSKDQFKEWLRYYSSDMTCVNCALEHFYGPFDDETKFTTFVLHQVLRNVDKIDFTLGEQKRDFIYIDDVVDAFIRIIKSCNSFGKGFRHYEIGTGKTTSIKEFVKLIQRLTHNTATFMNFGAIPYRANEVMESHVDIQNITQMGWKPLVALEEGMRKTIAIEQEQNQP